MPIEPEITGDPPQALYSNKVTAENVEDCFSMYAAKPTPEALEKRRIMHAMHLELAQTILSTVPDCADRSAALRSLRECFGWSLHAIDAANKQAAAAEAK